MKAWLGSLKLPHVFTLLFAVTTGVSLASWFVPSGSFERVETQVGTMTKELVVPGSFEVLDKARSVEGILFSQEAPGGAASPVSLQGLLSAIPRGLEDSADIVFFIFMMGGVFGILRATGTITATLGWLTQRFEKRVWLLVSVLTVLMGIGGSTLGMGEEFIPLVPVFLLLSKRLGYDRLFGLSVVVLASGIGFAAATTNPFTVNIAQSIAGVPLNSGIGLRVIFFVICISLTIAHILRYGAKIKADPNASLVADTPDPEMDPTDLITPGWRHGAIVATCLLLFAGIMVGVQKGGWWLNDMAGGFLLMGLLAAAIGKLSPTQATQAFVHGLSDMVVAALVVGFARGIVVVMNDAQILDSLIFAASSLLDGVGPHLAAQGMLLFQTCLNFFIPSGSGQAAVTMPLMAPLADLQGLTRQTAVFAFQCGDGFSNMVIPTSGSLMAMLLMAQVPYEKWLKFVGPLILQLLVVSAVFLGIAVEINY